MSATSAAWETVAAAFPSQQGPTLRELSDVRPVLALFVRHSGCLFCREALADLAAARPGLESRGWTTAIIHLDRFDARVAALAARLGLADVPRFADRDRQLYRAAGLERGAWGQLMGPAVLVRVLPALWAGHGVSWPRGDGFQLPGVLLLENGRIVQRHRHATAAERPDLAALAAQWEAAVGKGAPAFRE